ncbi:hypothetical protein [Microbacterium sp.]|uniref:hypothetical protein n=1 Tax=Microbacterium sp. TaxID=51671 RepID=UPI0028116C3B|nr:hypothetical protein [Microbacterium sp.]
MVDKRRSKYVGGSEGAPPLPPPGGYHGARRIAAGLDAAAGLGRASGPSATGPVTYTAPGTTAGRRSANAIGLVAIVVTALFVLVLLLMMGAGGTDALYGPSMLVLQLVILGLIVWALLTPRGRTLGSIALATTLVFNVATVGAMGALRSAATHAYDGTKSEEQQHAAAYPGMKDVANHDVLAQSSLEQVQRQGDELMSDLRQRITAEYGYTWVESGERDISPERNGYGGESMLRNYTSTSWTTEQPIHDNARKREIRLIIEQVLAEQGMYALWELNGSQSGISDDMLAKLYGSANVERQHTWEWYSDNYPEPLRFYADFYDLSKDATGEFRTQRQAISDQTGEPLEGLQFTIYARQLLSESDRAEFEERLKDYPGF